MVFSTFEFMVFFAVCLVIHWGVLPLFREPLRKHLQHWFLLLASYYFYMSWNAKFAILLFGITAMDWTLGLLIQATKAPAKRKLLLVASIVMNLGVLCVYKYTPFILNNVNLLTTALGRPTDFMLALTLPIGISFHTFQSMSYTIEVYRGNQVATRSLRDFALFVAFFPQLVAGPIVRAIEFLPQLAKPVCGADVNIRRAVNYFIMGFIKKVIISDHISVVSDAVFGNPGGYDTAGTWVGVLAYSLQIYCDFSGYTDMAIGAACLLGYHLPENFNMPYISRNMTEFWHRWHMSLSRWLKDYLYIPLGGNRGSKLFCYRNLMLTMLLGGLWHGASWTFVVWGGLHGLALVTHKMFRTRFPNAQPRTAGGRAAYSVLCWTATMIFVCITWVFFRAQTFEDAWLMIQKMFFMQNAGMHVVPGWFVFSLGFVAIMHALGVKCFSWLDRSDRPLTIWPLESCAYAVVIFLIIIFSPDGSQPFIYFQF